MDDRLGDWIEKALIDVARKRDAWLEVAFSASPEEGARWEAYVNARDAVGRQLMQLIEVM